MQTPLPLFALALVCSACSSTSGDGGGATDAFLGAYACTFTEVLTFTAPAASSTSTPGTSTLTITPGAESGKFVTTNRPGDGSSCVLTWSYAGGSATADPGQSCTGANGVVVTFTSATAALTGTTFTDTLSGSLSGTADDMGAEVPVAGTQSITGTCTPTGLEG